MPGRSCWEKVHQFYIPNGLFKDYSEPLSPPNDGVCSSTDRMIFQCCSVGSTLYKKKKYALGETIVRRGRKKNVQTDTGSDEDYMDAQEVII